MSGLSREYALAALRAASAKARMMVADADLIGIGLRDGWVSPEGALLWAHDAGVLDLVGQAEIEADASEIMGAAQ
jgi:hypothetical protein